MGSFNQFRESGVLLMNGNGIERVGRIQLRVHEFEKSVDYYTNVVGLDINEQAKIKAVDFNKFEVSLFFHLINQYESISISIRYL